MARLLFPEDEPAIQGICEDVLHLAGHVCEIAEDGIEARSRVQATEYDALVSDGMMPGMDGPELMEEVRPLVEGRVPCAIKSATPPDDWFELGFEWSIEKPFCIRHLVDVCNEMVQARVRSLLESRGAAIRLRREDRPPNDVEVLERRRELVVTARGGEPNYPGPRRVFRARSPRAAIDHLIAAVRDWFELLEAWAVCGDWPEGSRWPESRRADVLSTQEVRLGDEQLRRAAARAQEPLRTQIYLALACVRYRWLWMLGPGIELAVDSPEEAHIDRGEFHCETGPALRYSDGWEVYALRGVCVPKHVITHPDRITVEEIRKERHVEVRRLMRQRYGDDRYLAATGAVVIDVDTVPVDALAPGGRSITRALIVDHEYKRFLVSSDGSTRRVYHMQVPASCETCKEAYAALSGRPGVRTIVEA